MSVGYPDYTRLQTTGGFEIASVVGPIASGTVLFSGYVGSWPYINFFTPNPSGSDEYLISMSYGADASLSKPAGQQQITRTTSVNGISQYSVLGPFVTITLQTQSGSALNIGYISIYGSYGKLGQLGGIGSYFPIATFNSTVGASGSTTVDFLTVQPGPASLNLWTAATTWNVFMAYYNYQSNSWPTVWRVDNTVDPHGGTYYVPMLDAPYRVTIQNNDTAVKQFVLNWTTASY